MEVRVLAHILEANETISLENKDLLRKSGTYALNLIGSPGAGKTSLLERTIERLKDKIRIGVIGGDINTPRDSERIAKLGVPVLQINTQGACHLDANMVKSALPYFDLKKIDLLFIENVGNLVCPATFNIGEEGKVVILSVPEGDDKPLKYPLVFRESKVLLINKVDLLPYTEFNLKKAEDEALAINPKLEIFEVSCKTGVGLDGWVRWLEERVKSY